MSHLSGIGDSKILQRKIPQNTRYHNVGSRVDTGASTTRYEKRIEEMQTNYRYRKNELFKRMKVTTFAQLVLQVANISMQDEDGSISEIATSQSEATSVATLNGNYNNGAETSAGEKQEEEDEELLISPRSTLQSVIRGVGEVDVSSRGLNSRNEASKMGDCPSESSKPYVDCPYLLLDVRDHEEFERCHITGAISFPIAMLSRTMNNFTRTILEFKNCLGKIIILYDEDERLATTSATTMVERGFDNIFVISGGLKMIGQKIPEGLVNGSLPPSCVPAYISKRLKSARASVEKEPVNIHASTNKERFSAVDLDKINHYLDESLIATDSGSRLSRQSSASLRSNAYSKASSMSSIGSMSGRRPWK